MNPIECIKKKYSDYEVKKCKEKGCSLNLYGLRNHICLIGEKFIKFKQNISICDRLLFYPNSNFITAAIELKSGEWDLEKVSKQLSSGSKQIIIILRECGIDLSKVEFYPILIHNEGPKNISEKKKLRQTKIKFNQCEYLLLPHKCGTEFLEIKRLARN